MDYKTGDFVMLKNIENFNVKRPLHPDLNIFEISEILPDGFCLEYIDEIVPKNEVLPIPINGKDDRWIYVDSLYIMANGQCTSTNYAYYLDRIEIEGELLREITKKRVFQFVNQAQDYLRDVFGRNELKINDFML